MDYVFVCIGTNKLIEDSFGPRVGDILENNFGKHKNIKVLGTTKFPVHFQNAPVVVDYLKSQQGMLIIIDSALGSLEKVGNTYINIGGIEIGKAFGKSLYFPGNLNIKTVVGTQPNAAIYESTQLNRLIRTEQENKMKIINKMAQNLANQITRVVYELI